MAYLVITSIWAIIEAKLLSLCQSCFCTRSNSSISAFCLWFPSSPLLLLWSKPTFNLVKPFSGVVMDLEGTGCGLGSSIERGVCSELALRICLFRLMNLVLGPSVGLLRLLLLLLGFEVLRPLIRFRQRTVEEPPSVPPTGASGHCS